MAIRVPVTFSADASALDRELTSKTQSAGSRAAGFLGKTLKRGAQVAGAGVAAVLGTALYKGFSRLNQIDQAEAKLKGLGYTGGEVSGIMESVTKSVTGTAFGLDEAAGAAVGALSAGVKEGKDLERYLSLVGDAATQAGVDFGHMATIFDEVRGETKLTGKTLRQLQNNQVPVLSWLADAYNVPAAEMRKMVSDGEISAKEFEKVVRDRIGGSALKAGDTVQGSFKNTQAALARFGAALLQPAFKQIPGILGSVTAAIDSVTPVASAMASQVGQAFADLLGSIDFSGVAGALGKAFAGLGSIDLSGFTQLFSAMGKHIQPLVGIVADFAKEAAGVLGPAIVDIAKIINGQVLPAFAKFLPVLTPITKIILKAFGGVAIGVLKQFLGVVQGTFQIISGIFNAFTGILTGDWSLAWEGVKQIVSGAVKVVVSVVTGLWTQIKALFSAAGSVIAGVWKGLWNSLGKLAKSALKGLVGVFRSGIQSLRQAVSNGVKAIVNAFKNLFKSLGNLVKNGWKTIRNVFSNSVKAVRQVASNGFNAVRNAVGNAMGAALNRVRNVWSSIRTAFSNGVSRSLDIVTGLAGKISGRVGRFLSAGKDLAKAVWDGLKAGFSAGAGVVSSIVNSIRTAINNFLGLPRTLGKGPLKFTIPKFARGTNYAPGGVALVGEQGPELVDLPRGARVYTASQTDAMMRAKTAPPAPGPSAVGASTVTINQNYYGPSTGRERLRELEWSVRYATNAKAGAA